MRRRIVKYKRKENLMPQMDMNDLIRIIGEQTLEVRGLRQMVQEGMQREAEKDKIITNLQKQIGADNGEPT